MTTPSKILFSIPSLFGLLNLTTYVYPKSLTLITAYMDFQTWDIVVLALTLIQVGFVLSIIWRSDYIETTVKRKWTWLAVIFNSISCLWFIWIEYEKLKKLKTAPNTK